MIELRIETRLLDEFVAKPIEHHVSETGRRCHVYIHIYIYETPYFLLLANAIFFRRVSDKNLRKLLPYRDLCATLVLNRIIYTVIHV